MEQDPRFIALVRKIRPCRIEDLWESSLTCCSNVAGALDDARHILAENLESWASNEEIDDFLSDDARLQKMLDLMAKFAETVGKECENNKMTEKEGIVFVPMGCAGCSTPHDASLVSSTEKVKLIQCEYYGPLHICIIIMTVVGQLLTRKNSDKLLMIMSKDTREDHYLNIAGSQEEIVNAYRSKPGEYTLAMLIGLIDNCHCFPKACHLAAGILSLIICRRPATSLHLVNEFILVAFCKYLRLVQDSTSSNRVVENYYGIVALLNVLPALYQFAGWREYHHDNILSYRTVIANLRTIVCIICHNLVHKGDIDSKPSLENFPEMENVEPLIIPLLVIEEDTEHDPTWRKDYFASNPKSFAVIACVELLGWWNHKGIKISRSNTIKKYKDDILEWSRNIPKLGYIEPILNALCKNEKAPKPSSSKSLLYGPLIHAFRRCGLPTCRKTVTETGNALFLCNGCDGMEQYCSKAHQKQHWKTHKFFCKRNSRKPIVRVLRR